MTGKTVTREAVCRVKFCPAPRDPDFHQCWCGSKEIEHHHVESRGMGGSKLKKNVVALCHRHHEAVTLHECFDIVTDFGWSKSYTYLDTDGTVLHQRKLEAGSAAADDGTASPELMSPVGELGQHGPEPMHSGYSQQDSSAAAPSASGESSAAEAGKHRGLGDVERTDKGSLPLATSSGMMRGPKTERPGPSREAMPAIGASSAAPFSLDDWQEEGKKLAEMGYALKDATSMWQFTVGDWFVRGEDALGEEVYGHIDWVGFSSVALRQYAWVAAKVAQNTRVANLPWTYHRAVAALPEPEQKEWLAKAQEEKLSSKDLNRAIHGERPKVKRWSLGELRERYDSYAVGENRHGHGYIGCFLDWLEACQEAK